MAEKRSLIDVIDNTLGELGLPGLKDVIPLPKYVADVLGIPTPDEIAQEISKKVREAVEKKVK